MPSGSPQFTPRQLLDAGRRAEAEGKLDLAHQFYGHLRQHFGHTAEATEGQHGLARISMAGHHPQLWQMNGERPAAPGAGSRPMPGRSHRAKPSQRRSDYRVGRALATVLSGIGWLVIAVALPTLVAGIAGEFGQTLPLQVPNLGRSAMIQAAGALLAGGLVLLLGQAMRALFDQASAARELVAMTRARAAAHDSA